MSKWYVPYDDEEKVRFSYRRLDSSNRHGSQLRLRGEVHRLVAARDQKYQSNFVEVGKSIVVVLQLWADNLAACKFRNYKIIYRRYAGLFFCVCVDANDNELAYLEAIHLFVEILGTFDLYADTESYSCSIYFQIPSLTMSVS